MLAALDAIQIQDYTFLHEHREKERSVGIRVGVRVLGKQSIVERGGALVEAITFNRRVVSSTPALAALGKPFNYSCLCASA